MPESQQSLGPDQYFKLQQAVKSGVLPYAFNGFARDLKIDGDTRVGSPITTQAIDDCFYRPAGLYQTQEGVRLVGGYGLVAPPGTIDRWLADNKEALEQGGAAEKAAAQRLLQAIREGKLGKIVLYKHCHLIGIKEYGKPKLGPRDSMISKVGYAIDQFGDVFVLEGDNIRDEYAKQNGKWVWATNIKNPGFAVELRDTIINTPGRLFHFNYMETPSFTAPVSSPAQPAAAAFEVAAPVAVARTSVFSWIGDFVRDRFKTASTGLAQREPSAPVSAAPSAAARTEHVVRDRGIEIHVSTTSGSLRQPLEPTAPAPTSKGGLFGWRNKPGRTNTRT